MLEEVGLRPVGHQFVDVTKRVLLSSHESVVTGNLRSSGFSWAGRVLLSQFKVTIVLFVVVVLSVFIGTLNSHDVAECVNGTTGHDLIAGQVVVSNEGLAGLLNLGGVGELLSS